MSEHEEARPVGGTRDTFEPMIGPATENLREYLLSKGILKDEEAFRKVRDEGLSIVRRCKPFDAKPGQRTGLVVGYVQSGKTMSMTAVASLARDNGCRIVVMLAGVTTNLLKQNAARFRETLHAAGESEQWLIINSEDGKNRSTDAQTLRGAVAEWHDAYLPAESQRTIFFAVLKNHTHLDWLSALFSRERLGDIPALILDDEADQAGLNVGGDDDPSATYIKIKAIRRSLPNHTYLQYTATPQAPLLISIDDMLSPEFAELVEPGNDYTGGKVFFPEKADHPYVRRVPVEDQFRPGDPPDVPPPSLLSALAIFFVGCGVCRSRLAKDLPAPKTRSMLIHPSARNKDHDKFVEWATQVQKRWSQMLAKPDGDDDRGDVLAELEAGYTDLQKTDRDLPPFLQLVPDIKLSLSRALSKKINSEDGSEVEWANSADHILVGGEKLNRGYTVEGLMVTYMPRDSGGWNADTIQQRARFFGYKGKYLSLCRVFLHPEVHDAYSNYVVHERDVRRQLKEMQGKPLRAWRRAFFLDAKMRPTRSNVLSDPLFRVKRDKHWFVQRYPHADAASMAENMATVSAFKALLSFAPGCGPFDGFNIAETSLEFALSNLLLDFKAPRETGSWYAHLVTLANSKADNPDQRVVVVLIDNNGEPRERGLGKDAAITIHQGRSSKEAGGKGDKAIFEEGVVTIQIHTVKLKENGDVMNAVALYVPKLEDAIASGFS